MYILKAFGVGSFQLNLNVGLGVRRPIFFQILPKLMGIRPFYGQNLRVTG